MPKFLRNFLCVLLSVMMLRCVSLPASAIFQKDDTVEEVIDETETGWDTDLMTATEWTVSASDTQGIITDDYTLTRSTLYADSYYEDLVTTTKKYLGITETSSGGGSIAAVALAEWEKCEAGEEGTYELTGNNDGVKYNTWYYGHEVYGNDAYPWCCVFVSWCANECGYLDDVVLPSVDGHGYAGCTPLFWTIVGGNYGYEYYDIKDCAPLGSDYTPVPGDLMFFRTSATTSTYDHIGIVVDITDDAIVVVEGNHSNRVTKTEYSWTNLKGHAYYASIVHVIYPDVGSDAQSIYNYMVNQFGFTPTMAAAIMSCMLLESGLCAKNWGWDDYGCSGCTGKSLFGHCGIGFGLCMWTNKYYGSSSMLTGFTRMVKWCDENGYEFDSTIGQLNYMWYDMQRRYSNYGWVEQMMELPATEAGIYQGIVLFAKWYEGNTLSYYVDYCYTRYNTYLKGILDCDGDLSSLPIYTNNDGIVTTESKYGDWDREVYGDAWLWNYDSITLPN